MESEQSNPHSTASANSWEALQDAVQERAVCFLPASQRTSLRAASRYCRHLVNRCATTLMLTKATAGPIDSLNLPSRLPNLRILHIRDPPKPRRHHFNPNFVSKFEEVKKDTFTDAELLQVFTSPGVTHPWTQLTSLDLSECWHLTVLMLSAILKMLPNLQNLAVWTPDGRDEAITASQAIAQLAHLRNLLVFTEPDFSKFAPINPGAIQPLCNATALRSLTLSRASSQAIEAVSSLTTLTELVANTVWQSHGLSQVDDDGPEPTPCFAVLAGLPHLAALEVRDAVVNMEELVHALQDLAALRKLHLLDVFSGVPDDEAAAQLFAISKLQQLTDVAIRYRPSDTDDHNAQLNHVYALAGSLQLPGLEWLRLGGSFDFIEDDNLHECLAQPAACAASLHTLTNSGSNLAILNSVLVESLKQLKHVHLSLYTYFEIDEGCTLATWMAAQTAVESLTIEVEYGAFIELPSNVWALLAQSCCKLRKVGIRQFEDCSLLAGLRHLHQVEELELKLPGMRDADLAELIHMPRLRLVKLVHSSRLSAQLLQVLAQNPAIRRIELAGLGWSSKHTELADAVEAVCVLRPNLEVAFVNY